MTIAVPLWLVSLKCCFAFGPNSIFGSVNPIKILISLSMLEYPFDGIFGRTGGAVCPFLFSHQNNKKGTNNQSRERVAISTKYFRTLISSR